VSIISVYVYVYLMHWPSIALYMASSFLIVIFNKIILTQFQFPSVPYLMFWQSVVSAFVFRFKLKQRVNCKMIVVSVLNVANIFFGLNAAGTLNIAMFTALRRVSILMTLVAQWWFLDKQSSRTVIASIAVMVGGSFVAALNDLAFDAQGYLFVMTNNLFTAASQIAAKKAMDDGVEKESILFYSAVASIVISSSMSLDFHPRDFALWSTPAFQFCFISSIVLGIAINYGASWVIEKNDALTLAVAGSTKSAVMGLIVCLGLFDATYKFSVLNFAGLQISAIASFFYVYYAKKKTDPPCTDIKQSENVQIQNSENVEIQKVLV